MAGRRYLYLIRHGQYDSRQPSPHRNGNGLSSTGMMQAYLTAQALRHVPITAIHYSNMCRAEETARPFISTFPDATVFRTSRLRETIPYLPDRYREFFPTFEETHISQMQVKAENTYRYYVKPRLRGVKHEILVSHGNLIRYFAAFTLDTPAAWVNMKSHNCGITRLVIEEDGLCSLISYNDIQHLPPEMWTDNMHPA